MDQVITVYIFVGMKCKGSGSVTVVSSLDYASQTSLALMAKIIIIKDIIWKPHFCSFISINDSNTGQQQIRKNCESISLARVRYHCVWKQVPQTATL